MDIFRSYIDSPLGRMRVLGTERGITHVDFDADPSLPPLGASLPTSFRQAADQLEEYFAGNRTAFHSLPLVQRGTDFQLRVWEATMDIGYGETVRYGDIAKMIGSPDAVRAVGTALGRNTLCVIVPCHRVLPKSGDGGGYAWGAERKEWLLRHEQAVA